MITNIHQETGQSVRRVCEVLVVPRSSYFHAANPTPSQLEDRRLGDLIEAIFNEHRKRYGYRRIYQELRDKGEMCAATRVRRLMKARGLKALNTRSYIPRTSDGKASRPNENLLKDQAIPSQSGRVFVGDITYIPFAGGWLYLAVVIDLCTRRVVGWHIDTSMKATLVCEALRRAKASIKFEPEAIFHSDRGSQYGSREFRDLLATYGFLQSMSAKANPYDNAWTESFMATLKREMLGDGIFESLEDARAALFDYIEAYYNLQRKHSALGYQTPLQAEHLILTLTQN